jgi:hypothetical protein
MSASGVTHPLWSASVTVGTTRAAVLVSLMIARRCGCGNDEAGADAAAAVCGLLLRLHLLLRRLQSRIAQLSCRSAQ